ncbi:MAG: methyl-accepting chemotaxis protein, partial [Gammaproteobacteria bacterium]|nr:methyl-accepting chemotaxis protein [Gammaproteobacteria bacterium]
MANKTDTSSIFRIVAVVTVILLLAAAALTYLQGGGGNGQAAELAALSQSIPSQAGRAIAGEEGGFDNLDANLKRLAQLRRTASGSVAGSSSQWQQLESRAAAIVAKRGDVETLTDAGSVIAATAADMLKLSNELLDRSGSTAVIQDFQQRVARIGRAAPGLTVNPNSATVATGIANDVAFLRTVADALGGESTELDVRALNDEGKEVALVPLTGLLTELETQVGLVSSSVGQVSGLSEVHDELVASATALSSAFAGAESASSLPGILQANWIPLGLIALALLSVVGLLVLNSRSAHFEATAKVQAEQNERNQQAILRLLDEMGSLADGDLTVEATVTEDITGTIADSFNYAIEELRKLVATVNETAIMVDSAAKQTESTASHLAKAADNQGREINAATESVVSMAASIEEVSGNAERSSDVARHSVEVAHKGGEAVRRTIDGMNAIRETIQDTSKRIKRLGESSQEIGNIVELINDIAEQTNILALNASIQASMAGEAGRGFAVVADEVQRLAERSTNATKQIEVLVRTIQADTNEAVVSMERSTTDVVGGALLAENAGAALDEIEQVSNQIASLVQNISSSARQQA